MEQLARTPVTECLLRAAHPLHVDTAFVLESLLKVRRYLVVGGKTRAFSTILF